MRWAAAKFDLRALDGEASNTRKKTKALLCLMMDICDHNLGLAFQMHIEMALANSVPPRAIKEVIFHAAPEAGYTNALQALVRFHEVRTGLKGAAVDAIANNGAVDFKVDTPVEARMDALDPAFAELWRARMTEQWSRPYLSQKERAYLSLAADVSNQTLGTPFAYHVRTALQHGATAEEVRAVVRFIAEFRLLEGLGSTGSAPSDPQLGRHARLSYQRRDQGAARTRLGSPRGCGALARMDRLRIARRAANSAAL